MKKIFTLLAALVMTIGAFAEDYTEDLTVTVNGVSAAPQKTTISVTPNSDGTYNFALKNFSFAAFNIGDINMNNVDAVKQNGVTYLAATQRVRVSLMGLPLNLPVTLRAELRDNETKMYASMDINVPSPLNQKVNVLFGSGYQLPNSGFEAYHTEVLHNMDYETGAWSADTLKSAPVPNAWHSFMSASGYTFNEDGNYVDSPFFVYLASAMIEPHTYVSDEVRPGSTGKHSVKVFARTPIPGIVANGTITTGRMNAGSATATDAANHAWLDMDSVGVDENGDPFYTKMNGLPDSLAVWVKYNQGTATPDHPYATVSAAITDGTYYQEPDSITFTNVLALARNNKIEATGNNWKRIVIPFTIQNKDVNGKAILLTISTNADAGQGSDKDSILVDDIDFIYNDPTNVKVNWGNPTGTVTADDITVTYDSAIGAKVVKSLKQNGNNVDATVTVYNGDLTKQIATETHTYNSVVTGINAIDLSNTKPSVAPVEIYNLNGQRVNNMQHGQVYIVKQGGKAVKVLK